MALSQAIADGVFVPHASRILTARQAGDTNVGSAVANDTQTQSASQVLAALVPTAIYAGVFFLCFLIARRLFPRVYNPRSFLGSLRPQDRSPALPNGWFNWVHRFFQIQDTAVLRHSSLDAFLFLRSFKIYCLCCVVGCIITWPILFPVNATGPGTSQQLSVLTMAHAVNEKSPNSYYRYYAHVFCAYIFFTFLMLVITRETIYLVSLRQAYLVSPMYGERISSQTVLYMSVPERYLEEEVLKDLLGRDNVVRMWIPRHTKELEDAVEERDKLTLKLEGAITKLIRTANANRLKELEQQKKAAAKDVKPAPEDEIQLKDLKQSSSRNLERWLKDGDRPTHRLRFLVGKKVDTIDWCREELAKLVPKCKQLQLDHRSGKGKGMSCVFVQFKDLKEAQSAFQSLTHHQALHMSPRYTGMIPSELNWRTFRIRWWERVLRQYVTTALIVALIIFWSFPVAFVGALSSLDNLRKIPALSWLGFLGGLPKQLQGIVTGLLPSILLALLFFFLPIFLRLMAVESGVPTKSGVEHHVQTSYFWFQVIQVFLVTTLSSGIFTALGNLGQLASNPYMIVSTLSTSLPKASNFYLSYFIVQGLGVVSGVLLGLVGLILFLVLGRILDNTPRKRFKRWTELSAQQLGTVFPIYSNLFVIAVSYSIIAPLVTAFAAIGLSLFYIAYRYNFLLVWSVQYETRGLMYATCLQQMFTGIYLAEICLIGLFAIGVGASPGALGPLILMIIFLVFTILYHRSFQSALLPLLNYLPKTLEVEERRLLASEAQARDGDTTDDKHTSTDDDHLDVHQSNVKLWDVQARLRAELDKKRTSQITKFFRPDIYDDYYAMRKLVPRQLFQIEYDEVEARDAYFHPSIKSNAPLIWIPEDEAGLSKVEIEKTRHITPITDQGASLNDKNDIVWDQEHASDAPIYEKPRFY